MRTSACLLVALCALPSCAQLPRYIVKDHPVSMVQQTVATRILANGTHVETVSTEKYYRNAQGVYRTEVILPLGQGRSGNMHLSTVVDNDAHQSINWTIYDDRPEANGVSRQAIQTTIPAQNVSPAQPAFEDLGTAEVNGLLCDRRRITSTYPAQSRGNDQPYAVVQEQCVSNDYGILTQTTDNPISGKRVTTLVSLTPGEPDASYFQPPTDLPEKASR